MTIKHIVLSGGGPISLYGFGALKKLISTSTIKMENIKSIHGTSSGSLLAFFISSGIPIVEIHDYLANFPYSKYYFISFDNIFNLSNTKGVFSPYQLDKLVDPVLHSLNWDLNINLADVYKKTNIELNIYSVRFNDFKMINFNHTDYPNVRLKDALYSSCSVPIMFEPHSFVLNETDTTKTFFIDGGMLNNIPVGTCIEKYYNKEYNNILNSDINTNINNNKLNLDEIVCIHYKDNDIETDINQNINILNYTKLFIKKLLKYLEKDNSCKYSSCLKYNFLINIKNSETDWAKLYDNKELREEAINIGETQAETILKTIHSSHS